MRLTVLWEFQENSGKMPLTTTIYQNVLQRSCFSECERLVREAIKNSADALDSESKSRVSVRFNCRRDTSDVKESLSSALSLVTVRWRALKSWAFRLENALESLDDPDQPGTRCKRQ